MSEVTLHKRTTKLTESTKIRKASGSQSCGQYAGDNQSRIKTAHRPIC